MKTLKTLLVAVLCLSFAGCVAVHNFLNPHYGGQLAMYGDRPHAEIEAMQKSYIEKMTKAYGSREKASSAAVAEGWNYLHLDESRPNDGEINLAMRSFNAAWILWENNYEAYWGFGICTAQGQYNFDKALKYLNKAIELNPNNPSLLLDTASTYAKGAREDVRRLDKAVECYQKALALSPGLEQAYCALAITLYYKGDYAGAWDNIKKSEQYGGKSIEQRFLRMLSAKMPRPH